MSDSDQGHYCLEWDLMWITNKDQHFDACTCFPTRAAEEIKAEYIGMALDRVNMNKVVGIL